MPQDPPGQSGRYVAEREYPFQPAATVTLPWVAGWMDLLPPFLWVFIQHDLSVYTGKYFLWSHIYIYKSQNTSVNPSVCIDSNQDLTDPVSFGRRRQHKPE